jgi:hypothetical protein
LKRERKIKLNESLRVLQAILRDSAVGFFTWDFSIFTIQHLLGGTFVSEWDHSQWRDLQITAFGEGGSVWLQTLYSLPFHHCHQITEGV